MVELLGSAILFFVKHFLWEFVAEGLLWSFVKWWGRIWIKFFDRFMNCNPDVSQVLGIISALIINPITIIILIFSWPDLVSSAVATGEVVSS